MVFETIAMVAIFAARSKNTKDIVLTGNLTAFDMCKEVFSDLEKIFGVNFIIPENSQFATVIGALAIFDKVSNKNRISGGYLDCDTDDYDVQDIED